MPAAIAGPIIASAVGAGATAGASIYGSKKQSKAAKEAASVQEKSDQAALDYAKQQDALSRQDYERYESRMQPWRETSQNALVNLSQFAGVPVPQSARVPPRTVPIQSLASPAVAQPRQTVNGAPTVPIRFYGR